MKIRLYQGKFVYSFRLTELDTVKCSHRWNNEMQYAFLLFSWYNIWYFPSHKQASCFTVLEILFEKMNFSFHIPQRVRLSWYMTSLIVKVQIQYKLGVLMKENPEPFLSFRCRGCSAAILHYLSSADLPVGYIALTAGSWRHWSLKSITPKCFGLSSETVGELCRKVSVCRTLEVGYVAPEDLSWTRREKQRAPKVFTSLHSIQVERYTH